MAATYTPTKTTDLNGLWRKVQGVLRIAANFMYGEFDDLGDFKNFEVDWSSREITAPFDLNEDVGVASIPEGGYEAEPTSPNVVDASFTWILLNKRFTITKTAKWIQQKNKGAMISDQMKFQGRKALEAIGRRISVYFYGPASGVLAVVTNAPTGASITLNLSNAFGQSDLNNAAYIAGLFRVNERIALIRAGALVTNAIFGKITAITAATPSITVTFAGSVTAAAGDQVVFSNSLESATLEGTDYQKALTGWIDALKATSLQGISGTTYGPWNPGYTNTTAGRFTNIKYRRMRQGIANNGGGKMDKVRWSQGVENDVFDQMQAGLRFSDAFGLEIDGAPKAKGVDLSAPRTMLPGYVIGYDSSAVAKMTLLPKPGQPSWDDAEKIPDRSGYVLPIDYPCQIVWLNRGNLAYESNKQEQ
jgi:hypothetical protein